MSPCGHPAPYRLEGAIGGTPDVGLLREYERCRRSTLPPFLDGLVFHFVHVSDRCVSMQNFYHLGDFFVVSNSIKEFLERHAGCIFEARVIQTKHPQAVEHEQYWVMKVATRVDCLLPDQSFRTQPSWISEPPPSFRERSLEIELASDVAPCFANKGSSTYFSYPGSGVGSVSMDFSSVPEGIRLFEPLHWPHFLVIDALFARELERQCKGGADGYYFWILGFDDVTAEYNSLLHSLR
jgi:hypothetical protein